MHDFVPRGPDQRKGALGDGLPGRLDDRPAGAGNHLQQNLGIVLPGEGVLGQLLQQRGEDAFEGERGSQQLLDERSCEVVVAYVVGCAAHVTERPDHGRFAPANPNRAIHIGDNVRPLDRDIAMVFQNYALYPQLSLAENTRASNLAPRRGDRALAGRRPPLVT
jgi:hypothetical protein